MHRAKMLADEKENLEVAKLQVILTLRVSAPHLRTVCDMDMLSGCQTKECNQWDYSICVET